MKDLKKEIEGIKNLIKILNRCLTLYKAQRNIKQIKATQKDIVTCKEALKKSVAKMKKLRAAEKEQEPNETVERSRTIFF